MAGVRQQERLLSELLHTGGSGFDMEANAANAGCEEPVQAAPAADPDRQRLLEAQAAEAVRRMARESQCERHMDAAGPGTRQRSSQPYQRSPWSSQEVPYAVHRVRRPEHGPGQASVTRSKHIMFFFFVKLSLCQGLRLEFGFRFLFCTMRPHTAPRLTRRSS